MIINGFSNFKQFNQIGQRPQQGIKRGNPDIDAQRYASKNGVSLEEAKSQLKAAKGDPQENSQVSFSNDFDYDSETSNLSTDMDIKSLFQQLLNLLRGPKETQGNQKNEKQEGLPQDQDPDSYAQQYADENGLTLDEAKAELEAKYGKPQQPNKNFIA